MRKQKTAKPKTAPAKPQTGKPKTARATITPTAKITVLAKENPRRPGSKRHKTFGKLKSGMTVEAALKAGVNRGDLYWLKKDGHIALS